MPEAAAPPPSASSGRRVFACVAVSTDVKKDNFLLVFHPKNIIIVMTIHKKYI